MGGALAAMGVNANQPASRLILPATTFGASSRRGSGGPAASGDRAATLIRLSAGIEPRQAMVADIDNAMKVS